MPFSRILAAVTAADVRTVRTRMEGVREQHGSRDKGGGSGVDAAGWE